MAHARVDLLYGETGLVGTRPVQLINDGAEVRGSEVRVESVTK